MVRPPQNIVLSSSGEIGSRPDALHEGQTDGVPQLHGDTATDRINATWFVAQRHPVVNDRCTLLSADAL